MGNGRLGQPDPDPEGLLAQARRIAKISRKATDSAHGSYLVARTEEQYKYAMEAFDSRHRTREAIETRAELEQFSRQSVFIVHAPLLLDSSSFRRFFDALAASKKVGRFFNGTDNVDEIVALARRRMENLDRLPAAEDANRAATCMLWRAHREEEAIVLYDEYTDALVRDIIANISRGVLYLVEARSTIARRRLRLTGRKDEAGQLFTVVYEALQPHPMSNSGS